MNFWSRKTCVYLTFTGFKLCVLVFEIDTFFDVLILKRITAETGPGFLFGL